MLRLSRKVGQAIEVVDSSGIMIGNVRVMQQRRRGQIALGIELTEGYKVQREEVDLTEVENAKLKFKVLMYKNGLDGLAEMTIAEALKAMQLDNSIPHYVISEAAALAQEYEKIKDENNN